MNLCIRLLIELIIKSYKPKSKTQKKENKPGKNKLLKSKDKKSCNNKKHKPITKTHKSWMKICL